jgi:hypothetical protein
MLQYFAPYVQEACQQQRISEALNAHNIQLDNA